MFDKYEVVRRLQNGETLDEIADSMTAALNDVANEYMQEQEDGARDKKIFDMNNILDYVHDYILEYYTKTTEEIDALNSVFTEDLVETIVDEIDAGIAKLKEISEVINEQEVCSCRNKCKKNKLSDELRELADKPNVAIFEMSNNEAKNSIQNFLDLFINWFYK